MGSTIDFTRPTNFIAAVPRGKWTSFSEVARAAGADGGAIAIGDWLRAASIVGPDNDVRSP